MVNHPASRWPASSFLLCCAQPQVAETLGLLTVPHFLQLYASLEEALDAAVARPPYLRDELVLAPTLTAAATARTDLRLRLELRGELLHLAVRDDSPRPLLPVTVPDPEAEGGRGLWLVEHFARAWGVNRHPHGGKVVWCALTL
ncbi:MAG TPA: ATP-binding protein [Actinomycetes bacterium]|nr:ATP-binding protein [Actinomycetes bacterium]